MPIYWCYICLVLFLGSRILGQNSIEAGKINGLTTDVHGCSRNNTIIMMDKNTTVKNQITEQNSMNKEI